MLERRLRQVEALDLEAPLRIEEAIDRRREEALEIAVPKQDSTLVLAHGELANEQHGPSPQTKKPRWSYQPGLSCQALIGRLLKTPSDPLFERRQLVKPPV